MSKQTKIILVIVAVAIIGGLVKTKLTSRDQVAGQTIKIGAILPLSGDFAAPGEAINQGALLAIKEAQKHGLNVQYLVEDDRSLANGSTNAANKLVNIDKVAGVLTATVQEVKPAAPVFNNSQIPLLATWDSNDFIKNQAGKNIFTIGFSTEGAGQKMATYAYNKLGLRNAAVVSQKDEWSELIASAFANKFKALGGKVSVNESVPTSQRDFRTSITKAKTSGVDAVYFPFPITGMSAFLIEAKQLGLQSTMMTGDGFVPDQVSEAKDAAEGVYFTNLFNNNADSLAAKYKAEFGKDPADSLFLSFGYDGVNALLAAVKISTSKNISMPNALRSTSLSATDRQIRFGGKNFSEKLELLYKIVAGQPVEVKN